MERYERLHDDVDMDKEAELFHLEGDTALYPIPTLYSILYTLYSRLHTLSTAHTHCLHTHHAYSPRVYSLHINRIVFTHRCGVVR